MAPIKTSSAYAWLLVLLVCLIVFACLSALAIGAAPVPLNVAWQVVQSHLFGAEPLDATSGQDHIIWLIRAPRVVLAVLVGAGLAMVGAALQAVTRNPLADPHLLGATSGATLGAVVVVIYVAEMLGSVRNPEKPNRRPSEAEIL